METLSIIIIAVFVIAVLAIIGLKLYSSIKLKGLRQTAIDLIAKAEEAFEKGKNSEKFQQVFDGVYNALPSIAKVFLTKETVVSFVQKVFDSIKIALDAQAKQ